MPTKRGKKSYKEKMRPEMEPQVTDDPKGRGVMLIPTPMLVDGVVRSVRKGKLITPSKIRERLAAGQGTHLTCPLTTGILLNIVAGAAEEDLAAGKKRVTPYWRVVKDNGALCEKFPLGVERQRDLLESEGHRVVKPKRGKVPVVEDFERRLV